MGRVGLTQEKNRIGSLVNPFLFRVKKIGFRSSIFQIGSGQVIKFWPVLPCLVAYATILSLIVIYTNQLVSYLDNNK